MIALASNGFDKFSDHLLVGNFGDGRINAFGLSSGHFDGQLIFPKRIRSPLTACGLCDLVMARQMAEAVTNRFFTAGIADKSHGLFDLIKAGRGEEEDRD